jgi:hypothetical protein
VPLLAPATAKKQSNFKNVKLKLPFDLPAFDLMFRKYQGLCRKSI